MSVGGIVLAIGFFYLGAALLKGSPRYQQPRSKGAAAVRGRASSADRSNGRGFKGESWFVKAWNASGAPRTDETTVGGASAVVAGKATGKVLRSGTRFTSRAGQAGWRTFRRSLHGMRRAAGSAARDASRSAGNGRATRSWSASRIVPDFRIRFSGKRPTRTADSGPADRPADPPPPRSSGRRKPTSRPDSPAPDSASEPVRPHAASAGHSDGHAVPPLEGKVIDMSTPAGAALGSGTVPSSDWGMLVDRISSFTPDSDHELLQFMQRENAGMLAYATAIVQLFDTCVSAKGLDPSAVQGLAEYSAATGEAGQAMVLAYKRFLAVYQEIMNAVQSGVQMPYDGRFFSREAS